MLSLEDELATGRPAVFSLFGELRAASYLAVALITTGVGILIKNNADRIGPLAILGALIVVAAACYAFALVRPQRTIVVADYVLLLGALLISAAVGYAESQFHLLGPNWSRHLLFLALFHIATAYLTDSRLVLTAGLSALAAWFGAGLKSWGSSLDFGAHALECAALVAVFRVANRHGAFDAAYEHFAANLAFIGALSWAFDSEMRWVGVVAALALAALAVWRGLRGGGEAMVIYAIVYATIAVDTAIIDLLHDSALTFFYLLVTTPAAIVVLFITYSRLKGRR
jgi:hypothetical protein